MAFGLKAPLSSCIRPSSVSDLVTVDGFEFLRTFAVVNEKSYHADHYKNSLRQRYFSKFILELFGMKDWASSPYLRFVASLVWNQFCVRRIAEAWQEKG